MAENLKKQPRKGILKNSSSFDSNERSREPKPGTKWDEMNIIATLHPADKDYGHMKIEEPKTPYSYNRDESGDETDSLDADMLSKRLEQGGSDLPRAMVTPPLVSEDSDDEDLTSEEREIKKNFEMKRKKHYNEFQAVKLARKLMEQDGEDDDEEEESNNKLDDNNKEEAMSADNSPGPHSSGQVMSTSEDAI